MAGSSFGCSHFAVGGRESGEMMKISPEMSDPQLRFGGFQEYSFYLL